MTQLRKGWNEQLACSLKKKEATFDAGVTINDTNAISMDGFEFAPTWDDRVEDDRGEVTGSEHGSKQELLEQMFSGTYTEPHAKPHSLAGFAALVLGNSTATQDGALAAYKHAAIPQTIGTALESIQLEHKKGELQYAYTGVKGNSLALSGEAGGPVVMTVELMGSGSRSESATAFPSSVSESWMLWKSSKVWFESGSDISIDATLTQDEENISSGTPEDIRARMKSFNWKWMNNLVRIPGFGGAGVAQDIDFGRRSAELSVEMTFWDSTELDHFVNQDPLAIEFDLKGALIAGGGTMYYGLQLVVPLFQLKTAPIVEGGVNDDLTLTLDCQPLDDGTNPVSKLVTYTSIPAYLAA